jgi:hypothetical protein
LIPLLASHLHRVSEPLATSLQEANKRIILRHYGLWVISIKPKIKAFLLQIPNKAPVECQCLVDQLQSSFLTGLHFSFQNLGGWSSCHGLSVSMVRGEFQFVSQLFCPLAGDNNCYPDSTSPDQSKKGVFKNAPLSVE